MVLFFSLLKFWYGELSGDGEEESWLQLLIVDIFGMMNFSVDGEEDGWLQLLIVDIFGMMN